MMGEPVGRQDCLFYEFDLEDMVPADHLLRRTEDSAATRELVLLPYLLFNLSAAIIEIDATPGEDESAKAIRAFAVHYEGGNEQGERRDAG